MFIFQLIVIDEGHERLYIRFHNYLPEFGVCKACH